MNVSRLCGVGFFHLDHGYRGEPRLAKIRVIRIEGAAEVPIPQEEPDVWPPQKAWLTDADPLAAPGQNAAAREARPARPPQPGLAQAPAGHPPELDLYDLYVPTDVTADQLRERLRRWEPWRHEIVFGNGVRTSELATAEPFVPHPLAKWHFFKDLIPEAALRGRRALDVGSNIGHYSLFLRSQYEMDVVGIELNQRNLAVARFLLELTGLDRVEFREVDAERFRDDALFDLVLHLGTLDHLKNPLLALENAAAMLAPGGYLALELQTYKDAADEMLCKFVDVKAESQTCRWFLGKDALVAMLRESGFEQIEIVAEWSSPELIGESMRRLHLLARKR
jgi:2-polyprenyl-3-methyl-5-hydroxy-6-metoxy-1,4-benzoquinol methylase